MKLGLHKERVDAKRFGAKPTPRSGGFWFAKGDNKTNSFLIEDKETANASFPVTETIWAKIKTEALLSSHIPMLSIQFGKKERHDVVVLDVDDFLALVHNHSKSEHSQCMKHNDCVLTEFVKCQFNCKQHQLYESLEKKNVINETDF